MEQKPTIYYELNELISTVSDVEFLYEIKQQIEEHQQEDSGDWANELTEEQLAELNKLAEEPITEENSVSWEEYQKLTARWR